MPFEGTNQTPWVLICTALAMLTLPGVALFYGGMARKKNVLNTMGLPLMALVLASLEWMLWGEWLTFGSEQVSGRVLSNGGSPLLTYHSIACALALALIAGALIERVRFSFFLLFGLGWVAVVFIPITHWLWGGGWLARLGSLDYAGGAVIHLSAGVTALVAVCIIGPRRGYGRTEMFPNNLAFSVCGAAFMWVGWFGFSAGSGLAPITTAARAIVAIQAAASASALTWMTAEWIQRDRPTVLGTVSGAVAGLVGITPGAGYVDPLSAMVIGIGAGTLCYMVVNFVKPILGYDDSLDVFGMHGVGGGWGLIATGLFASSAVNPDGSDGLFYGYPYQFFVEVVTALSIAVFSAVMTVLLVKGLGRLLPARVDEEAEIVGLDLTQHGEKGYS